jgi:uncharacterized UPF0146 family protein
VDLIVGYIQFGVVALVAVGFFFYVLPLLKKNGINFINIVDIAVKLVLAIEQEFKFQAPDPNDPDYETKKAEYNAQKKAACIQAIKDVLAEAKLPIPSDVIIGKAVEAGVWLMNQMKLGL